MSTYQGKTAVITGASSGIGGAATELLVAAGANVHALDVKDVGAAVTSSHHVDLRDPAQIDAVAAELPDRIDVLFNCAGLPQTFGPTDVMAVNFLGLRHLTETLVGRIPAGGAIANIASVGGLGWPDLAEPIRELLDTPDVAAGRKWIAEHPAEVDTGYRFSKACVIMYTMFRSAELIGRGVRINSISPGDTTTPMTSEFRKFYGSEFWDSRELPAGRPATPVEQAEALLFLNSDAARYISGINLIVDAGATAARLMGQVATPQGMPGTSGIR
ncbi:coniferyl-alcohol dehydrogenase [Nocardia sp. NPDC052278]|uniref:coniferyl-alcohol dehydrogenase n=1 Tax=unclassified Nocardia TaxID=2637762 RepID=UPI0036BA582A